MGRKKKSWFVLTRPLSWPEGVPRNETRYKSRYWMDPNEALGDLEIVLESMGAISVTVTSNAKVTKRGLFDRRSPVGIPGDDQFGLDDRQAMDGRPRLLQPQPVPRFELAATRLSESACRDSPHAQSTQHVRRLQAGGRAG